MTSDQARILLSQTQYPQMTIGESVIARQWIQKHIFDFDIIDFNVGLGTGLELGPGYDDATRKAAMFSSQKRADIVARKGDEVTIVEVKPRVTLGALGQLLGYATLYRAEFPAAATIHLVAVGTAAITDAPEVLAAHGVTVELYPELGAMQDKLR